MLRDHEWADPQVIPDMTSSLGPLVIMGLSLIVSLEITKKFIPSWTISDNVLYSIEIAITVLTAKLY